MDQEAFGERWTCSLYSTKQWNFVFFVPGNGNVFRVQFLGAGDKKIRPRKEKNSWTI